MCRQASEYYIYFLEVVLIYPFLWCTEQIKLHANRLRKGNDALSSYESSKYRL